MFRENEILILIGAGCSVEAGIPDSKKMIHELEKLVKKEAYWMGFSSLYHFVKSAILYSDGIKGKYVNNLDIERFVNVLSELEKKEDCILYPFMGSWNTRLQEVAGHDFFKVKEFKDRILVQLKNWICLEDFSDAEYYRKFFDFQSAYDFCLRVFSLNYDLCLEKNKPKSEDSICLERGFDPDTRMWDWRRFGRKEEYEPSIYLYKLHGSIDWKRDERQGNILKEVENIPSIPDLIFGTDYKMQYIDPYLFYAYELRQYSLECTLILTIGYSFRDEHINGILEQAVKNNKERKVIIVSPEAPEIVQRFPQIQSQLISVKNKAKEFLEQISIERLNTILNEGKST